MKEVVNVFIKSPDNTQFLAVRRASLDKFFGDMIALPGGGVEDGETYLKTASREVVEEIGREVVTITPEPSLVTTPTLYGQQIRLLIFEAQISPGEFVPSDPDIAGVEWVSPEKFIESLRKFGYPESDIEKFRPFLKERGFTTNF